MKNRRRRVEGAIDEAWALLTAGALLAGLVWVAVYIVGTRI